jgi:hypothetical protein
MRTRILILLVGCVITAAQCPNGVAGTVVTGSWGGQHIGLTATANASEIEYDCAAGTIDGPIVLDGAGRFTATGTHTIGHGGPMRIDEVPDTHPARYAGRIRGNTMELHVTLTDRNQDIGTFTLERDARSLVVRCL